MLWAACCLGFFGFMQSGKFTCPSNSLFQDHMLAPRDVAVEFHHQPSVVSVLLRRSKTDLFGQGMTVFVGRTAHAICPVAAILAIWHNEDRNTAPCSGSRTALPCLDSGWSRLSALPCSPKGFPQSCCRAFRDTASG